MELRGVNTNNSTFTLYINKKVLKRRLKGLKVLSNIAIEKVSKALLIAISMTCTSLALAVIAHLIY